MPHLPAGAFNTVDGATQPDKGRSIRAAPQRLALVTRNAKLVTQLSKDFGFCKH
jgi:hypothetical protein